VQTFKIIFAILSVIVNLFAFYFYVRSIFLKRTKPHLYTWLIWAITQGTAVAGILYGAGGLGALELAIGEILVFSIFIFSIKNGTKNITKSDTIILILAISAILVWWQLHDPVLSILMICCIDGFGGYIPTFRKSWQEPWSERLYTWLLFNISNVFAICALQKYNFLTLAYLITCIIFNFILIILCLWRRRKIGNPNLSIV
jgi:hypothetical protein